LTAERALCDRVRVVLAERGIPDRYWSCGELIHDRWCLVRAGETWRIGYSERGDFYPRLETTDPEVALWSFVDVVAEAVEDVRLSVEAGERWRRLHRETG